MDPLVSELLEKFTQIHKSQLINNGIPEIYWDTLFVKLQNEVNLETRIINVFHLNLFIFLL